MVGGDPWVGWGKRAIMVESNLKNRYLWAVLGESEGEQQASEVNTQNTRAIHVN